MLTGIAFACDAHKKSKAMFGALSEPVSSMIVSNITCEQKWKGRREGREVRGAYGEK